MIAALARIKWGRRGIKAEKREREGKRSPVLRSYILPAAVGYLGLGLTEDREQETDLLPFILYLIYSSYVKQIFLIICALFFVSAACPLEPSQEQAGGSWGSVVVVEPFLLQYLGLNPSHRPTETGVLRQNCKPGDWEGSCLRAALPHLHGALSSTHNFPVATVGMFETKHAYAWSSTTS